MPLHEKKIMAILREEALALEQRCPNYREKIAEVVEDIISDEKKNRTTAGRNIQQQVTDRCESTARFLSEGRKHTTGSSTRSPRP